MLLADKLFSWWHHVTNPHCEQCRDEKIEAQVCPTCEVLRTQLEAANAEKRMLLTSILKLDEKPATTEVPESQVIHTGRHIPFGVKRQMLEAEDRTKAALLRKKEVEMEIPKDSTITTSVSAPKSVEALEKELGVSNG